RIELVLADPAGLAVDRVPHRVDGIGLEDTHAPAAVRARHNDRELGSLREVELPAPERLWVGYRVNREDVHGAPFAWPRPAAECLVAATSARSELAINCKICSCARPRDMGRLRPCGATASSAQSLRRLRCSPSAGRRSSSAS